ncbi:MAG: OFA family MFS transporter [Phycisphaerae bacterium]|nr:OFA family MFS transporter [Phycisphaerae bacterium]
MANKSTAVQAPFNRWFVVVGAILIQLALGAIYAWSVFTKKLELTGGGYEFSNKETAAIFSAGLAAFAFVMLFAGRWQAASGPRIVAIVGGIVLGLGYILGGFLGKTFLSQFICIGLIGGAGIGLAYVVPIAVCVKWFPDKKGMITGLAVAGFGFGATIWVKLAGSWFGGLLNKTSVFDLPGVQSVFVIYGIVFLVMVLLGSIVMVNPPAGWKPAGWNPPAAGTAEAHTSGGTDLRAAQMLGTPQYWGLLLMFIGSGLAGLMVIYCIRLFGIDSLQEHGVAPDADTAGKMAGTAMALYAILNGLGRIIWGTVSDTIGRKTALFLMCLIQGIIMLSFFYVGTTYVGLIIGACIIGFNFGGNFALFPAATADFFGNKRVGTNYPFVFLAYGIAGIAGPYVAGYFKDAATKAAQELAATATQAVEAAPAVSAEVWHTPFLIAGIACLVAAVLGLLLKPPKAAAASSES